MKGHQHVLEGADDDQAKHRPHCPQFNQRVAFWTSKGFVGASVYEQLATDTALPEGSRCRGLLPFSTFKRRHSRSGVSAVCRQVSGVKGRTQSITRAILFFII